MNGFTCDDVENLGPELALGILAAEPRAAVLVHVSGCPACRAQVEALARVADQLLLAAPEAEPPLGFETRVLDRLAEARAPAPPRRSRRRRWAVASLAAAAVVAAAIGGVATGRTSHRTNPSAVRTAVVSFGGGHWTCRVAAFPGQGTRPTEVVVRLDEPGQESSSYTVVAEPAGPQPPVAIGTITLKSGEGVLDATVPAGTGKIRAIRVLEADGTSRYPEASFAPA